MRCYETCEPSLHQNGICARALMLSLSKQRLGQGRWCTRPACRLDSAGQFWMPFVLASILKQFQPHSHSVDNWLAYVPPQTHFHKFKYVVCQSFGSGW